MVLGLRLVVRSRLLRRDTRSAACRAAERQGAASHGGRTSAGGITHQRDTGVEAGRKSAGGSQLDLGDDRGAVFAAAERESARLLVEGDEVRELSVRRTCDLERRRGTGGSTGAMDGHIPYGTIEEDLEGEGLRYGRGALQCHDHRDQPAAPSRDRR